MRYVNTDPTQREHALRLTIEHLFEKKKHRPTVAIALFDHHGNCFVGVQNNPEENWSTPQGGIDRGETVTEAALRELSEELGIEDRHISGIYDLDVTAEMPFPPGRLDKLGFTEGKVYFCVGVTLKDDDETDLYDKLDAKIGPGCEIIKGVWFDPEQTIRQCIIQPGVPKATESTREKGKKVIRPAIRAMLDLLVEMELAAL